MEKAENKAGLYTIEELSTLLPITKKLFFVGIGGVSMSALAMIAHKVGYTVAGSDRTPSENTKMLCEAGIPVYHTHARENVLGFDAVIFNAAIGAGNPEYDAACEAGLLLIYRASFLSFLMRGYKNGIGIAGMHGKTTTSAMLSHLFLYAKRDPAILIGAPIAELGRDFRFGEGEDFIFEACEYKDSFLSFHPSIAVVLNEEMDHPDYFKSLEQVKDSFHRYMDIPGAGGYDVINCDDENVLASAKDTRAKKVTFGITNRDADYRAADITFEDGCARFTVLRYGVEFCRIALSVSGMHNVSNALACVASADLCGMDAETIAKGLSTFTGAGRRMEYKGLLAGVADSVRVPVYDDFGHHPSEIKTTLDGARKMTAGRLFCLYQPHTYSRTAGLFEEFVTAFDDADEVIFFDIYAARETNTYGVTSAQLARRIPHARYIEEREDAAAYLRSAVQNGDLVIVMGAGDIAQFARQIV